MKNETEVHYNQLIRNIRADRQTCTVTCKKSSEISSSGNGVQSSSRLTMQKAEQSIQFIMRLSCAVYTAYHSMRLTSVDSSSGDGAEQCRQLIRR